MKYVITFLLAALAAVQAVAAPKDCPVDKSQVEVLNKLFLKKGIFTHCFGGAIPNQRSSMLEALLLTDATQYQFFHPKLKVNPKQKVVATKKI